MAGIDIGLDIFTLLLPVPVIRSLQMSKRRKVSLLGVFSLGFLSDAPDYKLTLLTSLQLCSCFRGSLLLRLAA